MKETIITIGTMMDGLSIPEQIITLCMVIDHVADMMEITSKELLDIISPAVIEVNEKMGKDGII